MSKFRSQVKVVLNPKGAWKRISLLINSPLFWIITIWGNTLIFIGAGTFHWFENGLNPNLHGFLDSLGWAVGIVTTVGSGNIHAVTLGGKILALFMMMGGAVFLWSYMALFVGTLVEPELRSIEREVSEIQTDFKNDQQLLLKIKKIIDDHK